MIISTAKGLIVVAVVAMTSVSAWAGPIAPFETTESGAYLIIARMRVGGNTDVATNNFELGANKAPVPANTSFIDSGGGPTLEGAVPPIPASARPVFQGIGGHGNIAVTDPTGEFELQDVGVYADPSIGIRVAGVGNNLNKSSNSFFNDPNMFPNTFDVGTQTGVNVNPNDADQNTRIDPPGSGHPSANVGVTFGFNHASLLSELDTARTLINALPGTDVLDTGGDGELNSDLVITLSSGLNVIDIDTNDNDFLLNNMNLVIDGPADAFAIFRLPDNDNMLISNSNVLIGNGGIGLNSVLFYTDQAENDGHFNFNNTIINGAAFWSLGPNGGDIGISNAQGCTQLVADIVDLDDVRFTRCHTAIPEPTTAILMLLGGIAIGYRRRG